MKLTFALVAIAAAVTAFSIAVPVFAGLMGVVAGFCGVASLLYRQSKTALDRVDLAAWQQAQTARIEARQVTLNPQTGVLTMPIVATEPRCI